MRPNLGETKQISKKGEKKSTRRCAGGPWTSERWIESGSSGRGGGGEHRALSLGDITGSGQRSGFGGVGKGWTVKVTAVGRRRIAGGGMVFSRSKAFGNAMIV